MCACFWVDVSFQLFWVITKKHDCWDCVVPFFWVELWVCFWPTAFFEAKKVNIPPNLGLILLRYLVLKFTNPFCFCLCRNHFEAYTIKYLQLYILFNQIHPLYLSPNSVYLPLPIQ